MQQVLIRLLFEHDLRLVVLAALICGVACFTGLSLLRQAKRSKALMQSVWLAIAAIAVGSGIWATHFIAMLAFSSGMAIGYDLWATLASLLVAMAITGGGLWFVSVGKARLDPALGGAIVGLGITGMHYVGMSAMIIGGQVHWDPVLVLASATMGMCCAALALHVGMRRDGLRWRLGGAGLLTVAICAMHFTGMGAINLADCFSVLAANEGQSLMLSIAVGSGSLLILALALSALSLDLRDQRRSEIEAGRMKGLADAAVEGLIVCDKGMIVTVNASFQAMLQMGEAELVGRPLSDLLSVAACDSLAAAPNVPLETSMKAGADMVLPVEAILRTVDFGGRQQQAIAIRNLSARREAERHIRFLAHHDALTGLANRASFNARLDEEMGRARRDDSRLAVLCLDLDRFKEVNDLFGHATGDALLQKVGQILTRAVGPEALAARLGGDEFAVLMPQLEIRAGALKLAEALLELFHRHNSEATDGILISTSIGIAIYPDDADTVEQLMSHADTALYRAKQDGRGIYRLYEAAMGAAVLDRRTLEHDLRHAISRNQLRLVYQPQVDINTDLVTGFEALMRWDHPKRGAVSPGTFIPIAEESGTILQLGEWALRTACAEAAGWANPLTVAINVSAVQLYAPSFATLLFNVLVQTGLPPARLEIEITETALINDITRALATLRQIKAFGVRIAMDDFGTGYSSLSNLRSFPFDKIKVDQSFIRAVDQNEQSAAIVRAVLGLGRGLALPVLAEGVERAEELEFLRGENCVGAQGYLMSRPAGIESFRDITSSAAATHWRDIEATASPVAMKA